MAERTSMLTTEQQYLIKQAAERLKGDFAGVFAVETIERFMAESQDQLESRATVTTWLPILIERFARDRLRALAKVEGLSTDQRPTVLFLCVQNAGRSQMAAGWLRQMAGDQQRWFRTVFAHRPLPPNPISLRGTDLPRKPGTDTA